MDCRQWTVSNPLADGRPERHFPVVCVYLGYPARVAHAARGDPHRIAGLRRALARRETQNKATAPLPPIFDKVKTYGTPDFPKA